MKAWFFGPTRTGSNIITSANINFFDVSGDISAAIGNSSVSEGFGWTPGQLANGQPTSNASLTIDRNLIAANSSYGYIHTPYGLDINSPQLSLDFSQANNSFYSPVIGL
jgi:hypothetical protein